MFENPYEEPELEEETGSEEEVTSESATEEPKTYTEEEVNQRIDELLAKKIARQEAKIRREYEEKLAQYGEAETVLKAGLGVDSLDEALNDLKSYYASKGIDIPDTHRGMSDRDLTALGKADASEIAAAGFEEVVEEVDRLATIGYANLSTREKATFMELAEIRKNYEQERSFKELGVPEETYKSAEFSAFAKKFAPDVSVSEIVELFEKKNLTAQKKQEIIGSMTSPPTSKVKEYYTSEEVDKLTLQDLNNPQIMEAVTKSMAKW